MSIKSRRSSLAGLCLALSPIALGHGAGCGSDDNDGKGAGSLPTSYEQFLPALYDVFCASKACCNKLRRRYDRESCYDFIREFVFRPDEIEHWEAHGGRFHFFPENAQQCLLELKASRERCEAHDGVNPFMHPLICSRIYSLELPGSCGFCDLIYGPNYTCQVFEPEGGGREGRCVPFETRQLGQPCEEPNRCDETSNLFCHESLHTCQLRHREGEACLGRDCEDGLNCVNDVCERPRELGESCLGGSYCRDGICDIKRDPPICVPHRLVGQRCTPDECCGYGRCEHLCVEGICTSLNPLPFCEGH